MTPRLFGRLQRLDWALALVSIFLLTVYGYYAVYFVLRTPYPGFVFTTNADGWRINDSSQPEVAIDDLVVQMGPLTHEQFLTDLRAIPFAGTQPGEAVTPIVKSDGSVASIVMPMPGLDDYLRRFVSTLWFFPFWLAGTIIILFLRPRDMRWLLLVGSMYLTSLWILLGSIGNWHIGGSQLFVRALQWLMVPVFLQLHMTIPTPIVGRRTLKLLNVLYPLATILAIFELMQLVEGNLAFMCLVIAILGSFLILLYRSSGQALSPSDKIASRLMLAGIGLAFGPGILVVFLPQVLGFTVPGTLWVGVAFFALPALPIFYTYAIYKRQLGPLEFRTNRLLSIYSFVLLYPTLFIILLLFGEQTIGTSGGRTLYLLTLSIIFVLATPPLLVRFQALLNRLAYGTEHDPADVLRLFARQIPTALRRDALIHLLSDEIARTLLIRESALYLFEGDSLAPLYLEYVPAGGEPGDIEEVGHLLRNSGRYLHTIGEGEGKLSWVHLAIALVTRDQTIGVWLFGRRDPDDFYPQNDIELLKALANQIAPVIENIRLYEALQQQADKLAEEVASQTVELKAERDRTQAILDSAGEGIFFTDPLGVILYTNPQMAQASGFAPEELIGKSLDLWQSENDDAGQAYRQLWTALYDGREWTGEMLLRRKDGGYRDIALSISPIESENGHLSGFVGVQSDISKLKEVDRLKSTIISNVSHELKTPLTTIKTYLILVQRGKLEKRDSYLRVLNRETDRLTSIIEDLLDLSALDTGRIRTDQAPVDVWAAVESVLVGCAAPARAKHIALKASEVEGQLYAFADRSQIEQVVSNLVVNAINYTPRSGQVVVHGGRGEHAGRESIWLSVADNGAGIPADELPYLFDRFFRGQAARDTGAPGTGLGLAICKEILDRHQGAIEVTSAVGEGTTFTLWLPSAAAEGQTAKPQVLARPLAAGSD
ncbi:MAG: ATP-binding protein [Candidatus Promineifilaceae bacterium]